MCIYRRIHSLISGTAPQQYITCLWRRAAPETILWWWCSRAIELKYCLSPSGQVRLHAGRQQQHRGAGRRVGAGIVGIVPQHNNGDGARTVTTRRNSVLRYAGWLAGSCRVSHYHRHCQPRNETIYVYSTADRKSLIKIEATMLLSLELEPPR